MVMGKKNSKVNIQARSAVNRRRVKDRRSFFKKEYLDHNPERRKKMIRRRMLGDRRRVLSEIMNTFWNEVS